MEFSEIVKIASAIIASLGGSALIIGACSNWLGKIWADRLMEKEKSRYNKDLEILKNQLVQETEDFKNNLIQQTEHIKIKYQKSEIVFKLQLDAVSEFIALRIRLTPRYDYPDKDWGEACMEMLERFDSLETVLLDYMSNWGAVITPEAREGLDKAVSIASFHKFDHTCGFPHSLDAADEFLKKIEEIETTMLDQVRSQLAV